MFQFLSNVNVWAINKQFCKHSTKITCRIAFIDRYIESNISQPYELQIWEDVWFKSISNTNNEVDSI